MSALGAAPLGRAPLAAGAVSVAGGPVPVDAAALGLKWDLAAAVDGVALDLVWDVAGEERRGGLVVRRQVEVLQGVQGPRLTLRWAVAAVEATENRPLADLVRERAAEPELEGRRGRRVRRRSAPKVAAVEGDPLRLYWDVVTRVEPDPLWLFSDVAVEVDGKPLRMGWEVRNPPTEAEDLRDLVGVLMLLG